MGASRARRKQLRSVSALAAAARHPQKVTSKKTETSAKGHSPKRQALSKKEVQQRAAERAAIARQSKAKLHQDDGLLRRLRTVDCDASCPGTDSITPREPDLLDESTQDGCTDRFSIDNEALCGPDRQPFNDSNAFDASCPGTDSTTPREPDLFDESTQDGCTDRFSIDNETLCGPSRQPFNDANVFDGPCRSTDSIRPREPDLLDEFTQDGCTDRFLIDNDTLCDPSRQPFNDSNAFDASCPGTDSTTPREPDLFDEFTQDGCTDRFLIDNDTLCDPSRQPFNDSNAFDASCPGTDSTTPREPDLFDESTQDGCTDRFSIDNETLCGPSRQPFNDANCLCRSTDCRPLTPSVYHGPGFSHTLDSSASCNTVSTACQTEERKNPPKKKRKTTKGCRSTQWADHKKCNDFVKSVLGDEYRVTNSPPRKGCCVDLDKSVQACAICKLSARQVHNMHKLDILPSKYAIDKRRNELIDGLPEDEICTVEVSKIVRTGKGKTKETHVEEIEVRCDYTSPLEVVNTFCRHENFIKRLPTGPIRIGIFGDSGGDGRDKSVKVALTFIDYQHALSCNKLIVLLHFFGDESGEYLSKVLPRLDTDLKKLKDGVNTCAGSRSTELFYGGDFKWLRTSYHFQSTSATFFCTWCYHPLDQISVDSKFALRMFALHLQHCKEFDIEHSALLQQGASENKLLAVRRKWFSIEGSPYITAIEFSNVIPSVMHIMAGIFEHLLDCAELQDRTKVIAVRDSFPAKPSERTHEYLAKDAFHIVRTVRDKHLDLPFKTSFCALADLVRFTAARDLSPVEIQEFELLISKFAMIARSDGIKFTPKMHTLERHVIQFVKRTKSWGKFSEEGIESLHHSANLSNVRIPWKHDGSGEDKRLRFYNNTHKMDNFYSYELNK